MATALSDRPATSLALSDRPATRLTLTDRPVASGTVAAIAIGIASATARLTTLFNARAEDAAGVGAATADAHVAYGTAPVGAAGVGAATAAGVAVYNALALAIGEGIALAFPTAIYNATGAAAGVGSGSADVHTLFTATAAGAAAGAATAAGEGIYNATASGAGVGSAAAVGTNTFQATVSGNEITDAVRTTGTSGDGRAAPDSSYGIYTSHTNLVLNGNANTNTTNGYGGAAEWTTTRATVAGGDPAKFGSTAYKITHNSVANSDNNMGNCVLSAAPVAATSYVYSVWVYIPSSWDGSAPNLAAPNGNAGAGATAIATNGAASLALRDQWQRLWVIVTTGTTPGAGTPATLRFLGGFPTLNKFLYVGGAQVEQGVWPTPYIDTTNGAATRGNARVQFPASLVDPAQGWMLARVRPAWPAGVSINGAPRVFLWDGGTTGNFVAMFIDPTGKHFYGAKQVNNGTQVNTAGGTAYAFAAGQAQRAALQWTTANIQSSFGADTTFSVGAAAGTPASTTPTLDVGSQKGASLWSDLDWLWVALGKGTIVNADLATADGWGNTDPTWAQLTALNGGAANPSLLWTADTATATKA